MRLNGWYHGEPDKSLTGGDQWVEINADVPPPVWNDHRHLTIAHREPKMRVCHLSVAAALAGSLLLGFAPAPAASAAVPGSPAVAVHVSVLVQGLNSPKHLAFGPDGALYVAESGLGDPTEKNCAPLVDESGTPTQGCVGRTGAVARVVGHHATPVLTGLESEQQVDTGEVAGPAAVTWVHGRLGVVMQDTDLHPDGSNGLPGADEFGKGVIAAPHSTVSSWALFPDFAAFAVEHPEANPGGTPGESATDSDPYAVVPYRHGWAVADAAANSVLWISPSGRLSLLARLPTKAETVPAGIFGPTPVTIQAQAVPTSIAVGRDGALYVGGLRGVPSLPGTADVYRVMPGYAPAVWATGFSSISDLAFDSHGRLLVLEYSVGGLLSPPTTPGALIPINRDHSHTTLISTGLHQPTGMAVDRWGTAYISNNGTAAGSATPSGQILRVALG